jgi:hypothetical protein
MTHEPRKPGQDRELERDLEALRSAWEGLESAEPPELLDQAVLNTARRDLERPVRKRPLQWLGSFATATVVVLAVSLFFWQDSRPPVPDGDEIRLEPSAPESAGTELLLEKSAMPSAEPVAPAREVKRQAVESRQRAGPAAVAAEVLEKEIPARALSDTVASPAETGEPLPPEAWIEDMIVLLEKGESDALATSLRAFVEIYPDHPLPAELAEYLP